MCYYETSSPLAQLVEHATVNRRVAGSIPAWRAIRHSIVASIPPCHGGDRGSIPRVGVAEINMSFV